MNKHKNLYGLILFFIIVVVGWWFYLQHTASAQDLTLDDTLYEIVMVEQGDLSASISVVGELVAEQQEELLFERLDGTTALLTLAVAAGNVVEAGDVLATVDPTPYEQALEQAQTELQEAEQILVELQTPPTELEIAAANLAVAQAELDLQQAVADLAEVGQTPDLTDLQMAVAEAQDHLLLAQAEQPLVDHDSLVTNVRNLQYDLDWNQRRYWELDELIANGEANLEQIEEQDDVAETIAELEVDLARAQAQLERSEQSATNTIAEAQADLAQAQQDLVDAQSESSVLSYTEAEVAVQQALVALEEALEDRTTLDEGADEVELASARAALSNAEEAVAEAQADLDATHLVAPFSGTVLSVDARAGGNITSDSVILTLANLDTLQVSASVDETTIRNIEAGQFAEISFDAFPGETLTGEVLQVPLQGELSGDVMVYEVTLSLQGANALDLRVGMTANVDIEAGGTEGALLVPSMAIIRTGNGTQVLVPGSDNTSVPNAVSVETGVTNGVYTEILSGLSLGDQVLVELSEGDDSSTGFPGGGGLQGGNPGGGNLGGPSNGGGARGR